MQDELIAGRYGPLNTTHQHLLGFSPGGFFVSRLTAEVDGTLQTPVRSHVICRCVVCVDAFGQIAWYHREGTCGRRWPRPSCSAAALVSALPLLVVPCGSRDASDRLRLFADETYNAAGKVVPQRGLPAPFFPHNGSYRANPRRDCWTSISSLWPLHVPRVVVCANLSVDNSGRMAGVATHRQ